MGNRVRIYQHIADILSSESSVSELENTFSHTSFDWDSIVIEGSKHLMLPALYCGLRSKKLLHLLPKELVHYLEELTSINRNRNKAILKQIRFISKILNDHKVEHVFLKGAALLATGCFEDNAERMVGDIDILIANSQLYYAFELLKNNGYGKSYGFAYKTIGFRHLDRLINDNELAAIELHSDLLIEKYHHLINIEDLLNNKLFINNIAVSNTYYLSKHQVLAYQLNDHGHFYRTISFKSVYDFKALSSHKNQKLISDLKKLKPGQSYLALAKLYFREFDAITLDKKMDSYLLAHKNYLTNPLFRFIIKPLKYTYINLKKRIQQIIKNKYYRAHVLKKIFIRKK